MSSTVVGLPLSQHRTTAGFGFWRWRQLRILRWGETVNRNEDLRRDLFDIGENFQPGAHALVLAEILVETAEFLNISRADFVRGVQPRLEALQPTFEDRMLLKPPSEQEYERCLRLISQRLRRFAPNVTIELLNVLFASLSDVVMRRGLPHDLALGMLLSAWDGTPLITVGSERVSKRELNGN